MSSIRSPICGKISLTSMPLFPHRRTRTATASGCPSCAPSSDSPRASAGRVLGQHRLGIERVHLRRPAVQEQEDDVLRFGREMRRLWVPAASRGAAPAPASPRPSMPNPAPIVVDSSRRVICPLLHKQELVRAQQHLRVLRPGCFARAGTPVRASVRASGPRGRTDPVRLANSPLSSASLPAGRREPSTRATSLLFMKNSRCTGTLVAIRFSLVLSGWGSRTAPACVELFGGSRIRTPCAARSRRSSGSACPPGSDPACRRRTASNRAALRYPAAAGLRATADGSRDPWRIRRGVVRAQR